MDPSIISAIISAVVSVLIAGVSGLYVLSKTGREIEQLKMKIVTEDHSKRFVTEASEYRKKYNAYISKKREIDHLIATGKESDGIILVQHILDFFGTSREYYRSNPSFLKNPNLDKKTTEISKMIDSGILNDTNENRLEIIWKCCSLCIELFEALYEQSVVV